MEPEGKFEESAKTTGNRLNASCLIFHNAMLLLIRRDRAADGSPPNLLLRLKDRQHVDHAAEMINSVTICENPLIREESQLMTS